MKVNISINGNCELVAEPQLFSEEDMKEAETMLDDILNPCLNESEDEEDILSTLDKMLNPCNVPIEFSMETPAIEESVYIEFLISPAINTNDTVTIKEHRDFYIQSLPKDGLYIYYCIEVVKKNDIDESYEGIYYDATSNCLRFKDKIISEYESLVELLPTLMTKQAGVLDYCEKQVFSICKLRKCVMELQKRTIQECNSRSCKKSAEVKQTRDLLFISIYILETLICQERFSEALDILNSLSTCADICNTSSNKSTSCNCK